MYTPFEEISEEARVWVYQSERELSEDEQVMAGELTRRFVEQWVAHQVDLNASFSIEYGRFLILAVDESNQGASGCSIDSSVRFIQELGRKFNTSFLDRRVSFKIDGGIHSFKNNEIKESIETGKITEKSLFFNNLVASKRELKENWKQKAGDSWLKRFFSRPVETN